MSSISPVPAKSAKNWELIENTELNGKFTTISGNLDEDVWEPCESVKNKGLRRKIASLFKLAASPGLEPRLTESESAVLPLDDEATSNVKLYLFLFI